MLSKLFGWSKKKKNKFNNYFSTTQREKNTDCKQTLNLANARYELHTDTPENGTGLEREKKSGKSTDGKETYLTCLACTKQKSITKRAKINREENNS